jgi:plastocyanin
VYLIRTPTTPEGSLMRRRTAASLLSLPFLLALGWATAGSALAGDPCFHSDARPAVSTGSTVQITLGDCVFTPTVTTVPVGATVTWTNRSFQPHEIVGSNLTWGAHEKLLEAEGGSIGWTFDKPGVYAYTCMLHPGMSGAIVVRSDLDLASDAQAASATEPGPTGDGGIGLVPALAAGGIGLVLGLVIGGALIGRRRNEPAA